MRGWLGVLVCAGLLAGMPGCHRPAAVPPPPAPPKPVLRLYTWSDYVKPELIQRFARENNCEVSIDTFDSNEEMYDQLVSREKDPYDLLFPSSYMVKIMHEQGMLQKLDPARIPNRRNIDALYLSRAFDREMDHSVPYAVTITCLAYLDGRVADFKPSWAMLGRSDLRGRLSVLADRRETLGAALKLLGFSLNSTNTAELAAARELVLRWKQNAARFENEGYNDELAAGELVLVHGYSGDLMTSRQENGKIRIVVPAEGSALSFDDMVIPANAQQVELAHRFINFILDPRVAAELTEYICYLCPNEVSYQYLRPETRADPILFPPQEVVERLEMIADLGPANAVFERLWDQIAAAPAVAAPTGLARGPAVAAPARIQGEM